MGSGGGEAGEARFQLVEGTGGVRADATRQVGVEATGDHLAAHVAHERPVYADECGVGVAMAVLLVHAFRQRPLSGLSAVEVMVLAACAVAVLAAYVAVAREVWRAWRVPAINGEPPP